jgi:hypothetical protein
MQSLVTGVLAKLKKGGVREREKARRFCPLRRATAETAALRGFGQCAGD